jgi:prepilin-type N-terminal cleavage/methylation domain-containing protein
MTRILARGRRGFTLIELLVVMAIVIALVGMTMIIVPGALNKDRAATAATELTGAMQINRSRAVRDGLPRGVRLLVGNPSNPAGIVTEFQHIESPPVFVPNTDGPPQLTTPFDPNAVPWVEFAYTVSAGPAPPAGTVTGRTCTIRKLTADQATQIVNAVPALPNGPPATLSLPTLGTTHQILSPQPTAAADGTLINGTTQLFALTVTLDQYPDGALGGQTSWRTYHFGVYGPARPLLGEETYQLPQNSCVDLNLSSPAGGAADYDILFGPSGQLVNTSSTGGTGQVFLWIRDPNRGTPPAPDFVKGGEQLILVVKAKTGAVGTAPANHDLPQPPNDPFLFARKAVSGQ